MSDWNPNCQALFEARRRRSDEPSEEDRKRVAARIARRLAVGTAAVSAAGTAQAGAAGAAAAGASKATALLSLAKLLIPLALAIGAVTGGAEVVSRSRSDRTAVGSGVADLAVGRPAPSANAAVAVAPPPASPSSPPSSKEAAILENRPSPAISGPPVAVSFPPAAPSGDIAPRPLGLPAPRAAASVPTDTGRSTPVPASAPASDAVGAGSVSLAGEVPTGTPAPARSEPVTGSHDSEEELRLVRRVDAALRRADFEGALRLLDEHDAAFGSGHFVEECAAARVLASCGAGRTEAARRSACEFFSQHPRSPMRGRIEDACSVRCQGDR
jgi:hypothetical protein